VADRVLEIRRELPASPEIVFGFLTDPVRYSAWMGRRAELDARPGGVYRVEFDEHMVALGSYVTVDAPTLLVFTWGWVGNPEIPPGSTTVEITLEETPAGTTLVLRHTGLPDDGATTLHGEGWEHYMTELLGIVSGSGDTAVS
jgi:uncharacterized protein YndB with AHSA1/START domain